MKTKNNAALSTFHEQIAFTDEKTHIIDEENNVRFIKYHSDSKYWYKNNKIHRDNNLPAIEYFYGDKYWYLDGVCYRCDMWLYNIDRKGHFHDTK